MTKKKNYGYHGIIKSLIREGSLKIFKSVNRIFQQRKVRVGGGVRISTLAEIKADGVIEIGDNSKLFGRVKLEATSGSKIILGKNSVLNDGATIIAKNRSTIHLGDYFNMRSGSTLISTAGVTWGKYGEMGLDSEIFRREKEGDGSLKVGDNSIISKNCIVDLAGNVEIGSNVRTGPSCAIYTHNHTRGEFAVIWENPITISDVKIEDNVWIGHGCNIMPGVRVGYGCILGAGAVLTRSIENNGIAVGVPARAISKQIDERKVPVRESLEQKTI